MRFRANVANVTLLNRLLLSQAPVGKICLLKLNADSAHFICKGEGGVEVWSQVSVSSVFENYHIESTNGNIIMMEITIDALLRAIRSSLNATDVNVRLTKRSGDPVLSFAITNSSKTGGHRISITQDAACRVLKPDEIKAYREPSCPPPDICITVPPLLDLKTVTERLKNLSDIIQVCASQSGEFSLRVESHAIKVETQWTGLDVPTEVVTTSSAAMVSVDVKLFHKLLQAHHFSRRSVIAIVKDHALLLYVYATEVPDIHDPRGGGIMLFLLGQRSA